MRKGIPIINNEWSREDFENPNSDKNIYRRLLENEKNKVKPGLQEFMIYARSLAGLTQEAMAYQLNIKQTALSRYENGLRKVPLDVFLAAAEMIGYEMVMRKRKNIYSENDEIVKNYRNELDGINKKKDSD